MRQQTLEPDRGSLRWRSNRVAEPRVVRIHDAINQTCDAFRVRAAPLIGGHARERAFGICTVHLIRARALSPCSILCERRTVITGLDYRHPHAEGTRLDSQRLAPPLESELGCAVQRLVGDRHYAA